MIKKTTLLFTIVFCVAIIFGSANHIQACDAADRACDAKILKHDYSNLFVRATAVKMTAAFLDITNNSNYDDKLLKVETSIAGKAELHTHLIENGIAMMRQVKFIDIPKNQTVHLKPRSLHIMLMKLTQPLEEGKNVTITLFFEKAGEVTLTFPVKKM